MSYYPKSKIITNLYTNGGEYIIIETNQEYTGYYHKTYDGKFFSGKNPNDTPVNELEIISDNQIQTDDITAVFTYDGLVYNILKNKDSSEIKIYPTQYYPQPTQKEYDLGEFQRYFVKKTNELVYLEVNKGTYTAMKNKDQKYAYEYYIPFTFAWKIYGNRVDILKINRNTVLLQEQKLKIRGIQEFLQNKYDKYYQYPVVNNLNTKGEELQRAGRIEYTGLYHVEADRGFVVGAQPSNIEIQSTLFAVNLEKEKILLDNALKAIGDFTYPTPIYDVIRKK
jgi:hypothetical protein